MNRRLFLGATLGALLFQPLKILKPESFTEDASTIRDRKTGMSIRLIRKVEGSTAITKLDALYGFGNLYEDSAKVLIH